MATIRFGNPEGVHSTGGRYAHAALIEGGPARRLVVSGQVGLKPDGSLAEGGEAQVEQALANLGTVLRAHGMAPSDVVKVTVFLTERALIGAWREQRAAFFGAHVPASTLLLVAGLADPRFLVEVEAEAVQ
ncbi:translation initiation inhibitor [Caldovatus sediminis]|uniref:Translation initiation inhibitor n=1 Tax=Caldovatus sediminis TaxID=2041189 RepID=A0A8J2ZEQ8_9PROT|nr:RidA family protein [Caldovatus sediminis]GGG46597.1 translation initiation inhibitor [Caldovatus sediminis]